MGEASDSYLFVQVDSSVSFSEIFFSIDLLERRYGGGGEVYLLCDPESLMPKKKPRQYLITRIKISQSTRIFQPTHAQTEKEALQHPEEASHESTTKSHLHQSRLPAQPEKQQVEHPFQQQNS